MLYTVGYGCLVRFDASTHGDCNVVVAGSFEAALHTCHHKRPQGKRVEHYHLMQRFQHDNAKRAWGLVVEQ